MTRLMALAAPVVVGTMLAAAALPRRIVAFGKVKRGLIVGVGVDGGHKATLDAEVIKQNSS
jgi:hypothetical protein